MAASPSSGHRSAPRPWACVSLSSTMPPHQTSARLTPQLLWPLPLAVLPAPLQMRRPSLHHRCCCPRRPLVVLQRHTSALAAAVTGAAVDAAVQCSGRGLLCCVRQLDCTAAAVFGVSGAQKRWLSIVQCLSSMLASWQQPLPRAMPGCEAARGGLWSSTNQVAIMAKRLGNGTLPTYEQHTEFQLKLACCFLT